MKNINRSNKIKKVMKGGSAKTLSNPEKSPSSEEEAEVWQRANRNFWESHPMRYDWKEDIPATEGTQEYFDEIDKRFFGYIKSVMPWKKVPFDNLIPFENLADKSVLEIGVGNGSHAGLIAPRVKSYTGIDLTDYAVNLTSKRLQLSRLSSTQVEVMQMDAEKMSFAENSFDFIWTWGVIHHSSNTENIIKEMRRVLKPNGSAVVMVYYRGWWHYYATAVIRGILRGEFLKHSSISNIIQRNTDGALARYYTRRSWKSFIKDYFEIEYIFVSGQKTDIFLMPSGRIKNILIRLTPNLLARFLLTQFRMGGFLISKLKKT